MGAQSEVGGDEVRYLETIPTISTAAPQKADGHDDHDVCWCAGWVKSKFLPPKFSYFNILLTCSHDLLTRPLLYLQAAAVLQYFIRDW